MKKMRHRLWLVSFMLFFIIVTACSGYSDASTEASLTAGKINPAFLEYMKKAEKYKQALPSSKTQGGIEEAPATVDGMTPYRGGYIPSPLDWSHLEDKVYSVAPDTSRFSASKSSQAVVLPSRYDLRNSNLVSPTVKAQAPFGTCWIFAAMAATESSLIKQGIARYNAIDLSEWYLAYYAYNQESSSMPAFTMSRLNNDGELEPYFDQGGDDWKAVALLSRGTGSIYESSVNYPASTANVYKPSIFKRNYKLKSALYLGHCGNRAVHIDEARRKMIKEAIMTYGVVSVGYYAGADLSAGYGYYTGLPAGYKQNHAVSIVGWDDDFYSFDPGPISGEKPSKKGAWIVRNSWGGEYGNNGYFYMSYEEGSLADGVVYETVTAEDSENVYQYDPLGTCAWVGNTSTTTAYFANIFVSTRNESIKSIGFYTSEDGANCEISIYAGCNTNSPTTGSLQYIFNETINAPGYHSIELDSPVSIRSGERFSVVIKVKNQSYPGIIPVEKRISGYSEKATAQTGQSWYSFNGDLWYDLAENHDSTANVCIKAFGVPQQETKKVTSITLSVPNNDKTVLVGQTKQIEYDVFPVDADDQSLTWTSSNTNAATVDQTGLVKAKIADNGAQAIITATANDGGGASNDITLTVVNPVESISFEPRDIKFDSNGGVRSMNVTNFLNKYLKVVPSTAALPNGAVTLTSANSDFINIAGDTMVLYLNKTVDYSDKVALTAKYGSLSAVCYAYNSGGPSSTTLNISLNLDGRTNAGGESVETIIYDTSNAEKWRGTSVTSTSGAVSYAVPAGVLTSGQTVKLWVKPARFTPVSVTLNVNVSDNVWNVAITDEFKGGDANGDGYVSAEDFVVLSKTYLSQEGDDDYDPSADFDANGRIRLNDFYILWKNYGCSPPPDGGGIDPGQDDGLGESSMIGLGGLYDNVTSLYIRANRDGTLSKLIAERIGSDVLESGGGTGAGKGSGGCSSAVYGGAALMLCLLPLWLKKKK